MSEAIVEEPTHAPAVEVINWDQEIHGPDDLSIKESLTGRSLTLGEVCYAALLKRPPQGEPILTKERHIRYGALAKKIKAKTIKSLTVSDRALILRKVLTFDTQVVFGVYEILDPAMLEKAYAGEYDNVDEEKAEDSAK